MTKKYKSDVGKSVHTVVEGLHQIGIVDKVTMRRFDASCLVPVDELNPEEIKEIRKKEHLSQSVFAHYLNVSKNLVSDWERGVKRPGGPALKLLAIVKTKGLEAISLN
ncbi:MAG: DNA-binding transcriptional regulator [Deltaproteobacteria bacterium]|jgi:putative transcriptional regulator|nr:DNA-binding transcriptional regulator [Deltaproteobacteria bacterium]